MRKRQTVSYCLNCCAVECWLVVTWVTFLKIIYTATSSENHTRTQLYKFKWRFNIQPTNRGVKNQQHINNLIEHNFITGQLPSCESLLALVAWPVSRLRRYPCRLCSSSQSLSMTSLVTWPVSRLRRNPRRLDSLSRPEVKVYLKNMFLLLNKSTSCIKRSAP